MENIITAEKLRKYLGIYIADIDWETHTKKLYQRQLQTCQDNRVAYDATVKRCAKAILLPFHEGKYLIGDAPESLLFKNYTSFTERDWEDELETIIKADETLPTFRQELLDMGVIYPIDYNPNARQAFRWLKDRSEQSKDYDDRAANHFKNLIYIYGGAAICNVFLKPELALKLDKVFHWRSAYFFEKLIHEIYTRDQIVKIKTNELLKIKNSDPNLVKKVKD